MSKKSGAFWVGLGIFLSRIAGLVRERAFAHFFGNSDAGDAFKAALKIPNFLQNLFGEGVLSASFIPVYAEMLSKEIHEQNDKIKINSSTVASIIGTLLLILTSILVLIGILLTPLLITLIAPGFQGEKKDLTIKLVQLFFPGAGFLVLSAWCLGILNSHRRFFLSYSAPIIWNASIIFALFMFGNNQTQENLAIKTAIGLVIGSALQFLIQLPTTIILLKHFHLKLNFKINEVRIIIKNFFPSLFSRGVVQISAYVDNIMASLLPSGAVSVLSFAQTIYLLPVSLFGMSISASELPEMSSLTGTNSEIHEKLKGRLNQAVKNVSFLIVPSVIAFIVLGNYIVAALFQTGEFKDAQTKLVWFTLIGSSFGLLASTLGRLYSSTFFSLKDTKTTFKFAVIRVTISTLFGYLFAFQIFPSAFVSDYSTAGLTFGAGIGGWIEYHLLRRKLNSIIGVTSIPFLYQLKLWSSALFAAAISWVVAIFLNYHPVINALIIFTIFGIIYFSITSVLKIEESHQFTSKIIKKLKKKS